jgi:hypothetical protein
LARKRLKICANLVDFLKKIIDSDDFLNRNRTSPKDFTRKRSLPFTTMILLLMNLRKGSIADELDHFYQALNKTDVAQVSVSSSAFCQARKKLMPGAFIELNSEFYRYFYNNFEIKTWYGFNLNAFDGSKGRLPNTKAIADHFGLMYPKNGNPIPMARISQMFDVLNKITIDAIIAPQGVSEHELASQHALRLRPTDLVLMDRGYPAYWLFRLITVSGANFCARISYKKWTEIKRFYESGEIEGIVTIKPSYQSRNVCRELGLDTAPMQLRAIRVELSSGETEILITSLTDIRRYTHDMFKELYHLRWPVEEDYKVMKARLEIENWSGESVVSVYQDFHAKVLTKNIAFALVDAVRPVIEEETKDRKYEYQINATRALSKMKHAVCLLFLRADPIQVIKDLLAAFVKIVLPIRPGREYPRNKKGTGRRFHPKYKPIA